MGSAVTITPDAAPDVTITPDPVQPTYAPGSFQTAPGAPVQNVSQLPTSGADVLKQMLGQQMKYTGEAYGKALPMAAAAAAPEIAPGIGVLGRAALSGAAGGAGSIVGQAIQGEKPSLAKAAGWAAGTGATEGMAGALSRASAVATMNRIHSTYKDLPIPTFNATSEALRTKEIADAGETLPAPARAFLRRVMNPDMPRMTLQEARDIYTNASKTTAKEWSELRAPMQRQFARFTSSLGDDIEAALNQAKPGEGTNLRSAMDQYHLSAQTKARLQTLAKYGAVSAGGYGVLRKLGILQ